MKKTLLLFGFGLLIILIVVITCTSNTKTKEAEQVVIIYMNYTLGTLPDAGVDHDKAREFLTPDMATKFTDQMFVPKSYCIQDGPNDVRISSSEYNEEMNWTEVIVEGEYDDKWDQMWRFQVVPVEGDNWVINKIDCL